jgi:hypothetical protein
MGSLITWVKDVCVLFVITLGHTSCQELQIGFVQILEEGIVAELLNIDHRIFAMKEVARKKNFSIK